MIKRLSILLIAVMLIPAFISAQEQTYMRPDGKFYKSSKVPTSYEVMKAKHLPKEQIKNQVPQFGPLAGVNGLLDTLSYPRPATGNSNFGVFGQDVFVQWFKAPADLTIKGFAFLSTDDAGVANGAVYEGKIVAVNWTEEQLMANTTPRLEGYYEANGNGYNNITAFLDNPDRTGGWTSISGAPELFGNDIWSDGGFGAPITPNPAATGVYQWINTNILFEPTVLQGEIFGIVYKNTGATLDADRLGVLGVNDVNYTIYPGYKFYANGRLVPGSDYGWWVREFFWDFLVAVDITGDTPPDFNSFTSLPSGIDYGPFTVDADITDENPGNPANAGVASAKLFWSIDGGTTWNEVAMTGSEPNFSAVIPAQAPGSTVEYYLEATDVANQTSVSATKSFYLFEPSGAPTLVVLNGYTATSGYPIDYFFGPDIQSGDFSFDHDVWAYGPLTTDLLNNYDNLIEICNAAPADYNDAVVRPWLAADGTRNYYLEGQEWLGARYSYVDKSFVAGDFEFDVLGINASFNDVSYDGTVGQLLPSKLTPQPGTLFGQPMLDKFATYTPVPDSIQYDPNYEITENNWMDGFFVESDVVVDVISETRGIAGAPSVTDKPCAMHRTLPAGNKIFFASYWNIAVNTTETNYNWLGFTNESPAYQALLWFGITISDVKQVGSGVPEVYNLSQNYPNPFNPTTTINFSIPKASNVVLKIYDVLGREVATLLNDDRAAGNYEVNFDASKLASGLYVYTINAGDFTSTKKMMLMK
ncbi:MAG: T9SS type A sorting domain-containing protein [Ignavibacteriaceae bacterium]